MLALAAIYGGGARGEAARIGGKGLQIVRDWVVTFDAAEPGGLMHRKAPRPVPRRGASQRQALVAIAESGQFPPWMAWCADG